MKKNLLVIGGIIVFVLVVAQALSAFAYRNNRAWKYQDDCFTAGKQLADGTIRETCDGFLEPTGDPTAYFSSDSYTKHASGALAKAGGNKLSLSSKCGPLKDLAKNIAWAKAHDGLNPVNPDSRTEGAKRDMEKARDDVVRYVSNPLVYLSGILLAIAAIGTGIWVYCCREFLLTYMPEKRET